METVVEKTLEERLKSLSPMYVILYVDADKTLKALTENSMSLDWSQSRANIFWTGMSGNTKIDGLSWAKQNCGNQGAFIVELMADDCPITVNFDRWLNGDSKYTRRNALFIVKDGFDLTAKAKQTEIREQVKLRDLADRKLSNKVWEAKKEREQEGVVFDKQIRSVLKQYQAKAKRLAVERGQCPKLPNNRYMNSGNGRVTEKGIELHWTLPKKTTCLISWDDLM